MSDQFRIETTLYQKTLNILGLVMVAGTFIALILFWKYIPDEIPGHYNAAGAIDRWGGKGELWISPIISALLYAGISALERFPQIWNTGVTITEENRERVYRELKNLIVTLKFVTSLTFTSITANSALAKPLPGWFLPVGMLAVFAPMIYFLIRLYRKK